MNGTERGNSFFWEKSFLLNFILFYEWDSAALRLSSPALPSVKLTEERESRFSFIHVPAYGNGMARFAQA